MKEMSINFEGSGDVSRNFYLIKKEEKKKEEVFI
jgi:hypothetical protein